jgi:hypothetical protein
VRIGALRRDAATLRHQSPQIAELMDVLADEYEAILKERQHIAPPALAQALDGGAARCSPFYLHRSRLDPPSCVNPRTACSSRDTCCQIGLAPLRLSN